ncbi:MAG: hypothetical protein E7571_02710 [Ruminococcaceae bacterium]|nr:hypothetical protein [Oscillospiraceae bacterium]
MLFQIYGDLSIWQLVGWCMVFVGLVVANEIARRTKAGGIFCFVVLPLALTVYFVVINIGAKTFAADNPTIVQMNGWFHYAKLYAATIGCVGFMILKYHWGSLGKSHWFKMYPFIIVGINILIAVASDFESAYKGMIGWTNANGQFIAGSAAGGWWYSSEGVWLYGGWWNILNGIAGLINIMCMTGWFGIYSSKNKQQDMLWPDMTWQFIIAYDVWNFEYTYLNLPLHTWYCGVALLLAPTFANAFWNKGGWIQNRANTLALWCMFAQVFPSFQNYSNFTTLPTIYKNAELFATGTNGRMNPDLVLTAADANPTAQGVVAILAIAVNVLVITNIIKRAKEQKKNPYTNEIFSDTRDFKLAMERAAEAHKEVA